MADTAISITELSVNSANSGGNAQAISHTTGDYYIDVGGYDASKMVLVVTAAGASTAAFFKVKDGAQYSGGGVGDLTVTYDGDNMFVGPLETARFKDSDGYIYLDNTDDSDTNVLSVEPILLA